MLHPRPLPLLLAAAALLCVAADWPQWRADAGRTAATSSELPARLAVHWSRIFPQRMPTWDDPLNNDLMPFDRLLEPIVADGRIYLGRNDTDEVVALDAATGRVVWSFFTEGPVRMPPAFHRGKVYATSDDGHLYCLAADTGELLWKFRGGPSAHKALGNRRLVSAWPARGGAVVVDDVVYFAASIWPLMGVFVHALDAETGQAVWTNDGQGSDYILQPHRAPSFAGIAPQGALAAAGERLVIPGGRSVPAVFDRLTGEQQYFHHGGKGLGGSFVAAADGRFYVHTRERGVHEHDLANGKTLSWKGNEPVLHRGWLYTSEVSKDTQQVVAYDPKRKAVWRVAADASGDLILAGRRLYAAGGGRLTAIDLPADATSPGTIAWQAPLPGKVERLAAGAERLVAVGLDGTLTVFGDARVRPTPAAAERAPLPFPAADRAAAELLWAEAADRGGYVIQYGVGDGRLLAGLAAASQAHVIGVDPDAAVLDRLRRAAAAAGVYGERLALQQGEIASFGAPPYIAHAVIVDAAQLDAVDPLPQLQAAYRSVRPYGGVLWIHGADPSRRATLAEQLTQLDDLTDAVAIEARESGVWLWRRGPLAGAGQWTHQYGDVANSLKSDDARVRAPLGVLWFGGNTHDDILPRHGHGPPEQVVAGRLIIQGLDSLSCRDVYTGRVLWKRTLPNLDTFGIYYDVSYKDTPLSTAYNQKHIPGANARGTNYVVTDDEIYVVKGAECHVLDTATGRTLRVIALPEDDAPANAPPAPVRAAPAAAKDVANDETAVEPIAPRPKQWGFIGVVGDVLLAGDGFADYDALVGDARSARPFIVDLSASRGLAAFDRHTGELLWRRPAEFSFLHNGIVAGGGRVYCLDRYPQSVEDRLRRRGQPTPAKYRIVAFDLATGEPRWERRDDVFGTWLGYSARHDLLLHAGARASDRLPDEVGQGMLVARAADGRTVWKNLAIKYTGPCILHNDVLMTGVNSYQVSAGAFDLRTGQPQMVENPLTGALEPWKITRAYGCNYPIACEHLLTFRSGAAGFYDLTHPTGVSNLGGFKSGCTSNLVAADGVLNAPDYTRTCSCSYQNQTSLALVHMPELEQWSKAIFTPPSTPGQRIERLGINFGAPGDRRAADGQLWLAWPPVEPAKGAPLVVVAGPQSDDKQPPVDVVRYLRRHETAIRPTSDAAHAWVGASALVGPATIRLRLTAPPKGAAAEKPADAKDAAAKDAAAKDTDAVVEPDPPVPARRYALRLHLAELAGAAPAERVFDVYVNGRRVLAGVDPARLTGGGQRSATLDAPTVDIASVLEISLRPAAGARHAPALAGLELTAAEE